MKHSVAIGVSRKPVPQVRGTQSRAATQLTRRRALASPVGGCAWADSCRCCTRLPGANREACRPLQRHVDSGWMDHLSCLVARFSALGVEGDLAQMSIADLWGLYLFLRDVSEGAAT